MEFHFKLHLLLFLLLFSSCVREEILNDIQSDHFQSQLVIHSLISPGDSIFVSVGKSLPLGSTLISSKVANATVTLYNEEGNSIELSLIKDGYYTSVYGVSQKNFSIQLGSTYSLSVNHPDLPDVEANCTVPTLATSLDDVQYLGKSKIPDDDELWYDILISWYDSSPYLHRTYTIAKYQEKHFEGKNLLEEGIYYINHDPFHGIKKTDSLFTYDNHLPSQGYYYPNSSGSPIVNLNERIPTYTTYELTIYLITPDEHMARYQASQDIFAQNEDALSSDSFIDLYRGIIPEYSNVKNGLGVFGAYLRSEPVYLTLE